MPIKIIRLSSRLALGQPFPLYGQTGARSTLLETTTGKAAPTPAIATTKAETTDRRFDLRFKIFRNAPD
jgi:hypothetical protein